jgi:hypothetical protein
MEVATGAEVAAGAGGGVAAGAQAARINIAGTSSPIHLDDFLKSAGFIFRFISYPPSVCFELLSKHTERQILWILFCVNSNPALIFFYNYSHKRK